MQLAFYNNSDRISPILPLIHTLDTNQLEVCTTKCNVCPCSHIPSEASTPAPSQPPKAITRKTPSLHIKQRVEDAARGVDRKTAFKREDQPEKMLAE